MIMKRNLSLILLAFTALSLIFLTAACTTDSLDETLPGTKGGLTLRLNTAPITRATEPGIDALNENTINSFYVFFFPQNASDTQTCLMAEYHDNLNITTAGTNGVQLTVDKEFFSMGVTYDIYVVANLPADVTVPNPITLGQLKALHTIIPIDASITQTALVMDSKVTMVVNPINDTHLVEIPVPLTRAVAKIRLNVVVKPLTDMASATTCSAVLKHYPVRGSAVLGSPYTLTASDYTDSQPKSGTPATPMNFYCYESNWSTAPAQETYFILNLPYTGHATNYYRVPVNRYADSNSDGQNPSGVNITGRLDRNRIYDVTAYIDKPGTDTETGAIVVTGNYTITDWTTYNILLNTIAQHYLGIGEYRIIMTNVSTHTLSYAADLPVTVTGITASCTQYNADASTTQINYTSSQSQFPVFTVNPASSTISITSAIPINYVPKYISFTVTNGQGLSLSATIVQYPSIYVNARPSTGNVKPEWLQDGTQTNYNLFTVNTLVPSSNGSYSLGDPTYGNAKTDSLAAGNALVSPGFIIASQYAIYSSVNYAQAQNRCYQYGEDIYRSGWRMPTKAELLIINTIQRDPNSAVKKLLSGSTYWSAFKYQYYDFTNNAWVTGTATTNNFIRCVYDVYKNNN